MSRKYKMNMFAGCPWRFPFFFSISFFAMVFRGFLPPPGFFGFAAFGFAGAVGFAAFDFAGLAFGLAFGFPAPFFGGGQTHFAIFSVDSGDTSLERFTGKLQVTWLLENKQSVGPRRSELVGIFLGSFEDGSKMEVESRNQQHFKFCQKINRCIGNRSAFCKFL